MYQMFETKRGPHGPDPTTGMYHVRRTTRVAVIDVKDIERGVHLIPKFGQQVGNTVKVKRKVEERRTTITFIGSDRDDLADSSSELTPEVSVTTNRWLDVLPHYNDFFVNVWTDNHIYKSVW